MQSAGTPKSPDIVTIELNMDAIKQKAEEASKWKNTYDTYIWLFAESEARLADAYVTPLDGSPTVKINKAKIVDNPPREDTERLAKAIGSKKPKLPELHWFLAERRFIFEKIRGREIAQSLNRED